MGIPPTNSNTPSISPSGVPNLPIPTQGIKAGPMTFLGMSFTAQESQELYANMIQMIGAEISAEQDRMTEALKKLRDSQEETVD
jgi:hypothetical protein